MKNESIEDIGCLGVPGFFTAFFLGAAAAGAGTATGDLVPESSAILNDEIDY